MTDPVVIRFIGQDQTLGATTAQLTQGLTRLETVLNQIAANTKKAEGPVESLSAKYKRLNDDTIRLSQTLGTSFRNAQQFSQGLGLSAGKASEAIARLRELDRVNATNVEKFRALSREMGLTREQFDRLNQSAARTKEGFTGLATGAGAIAGSLALVGAQGLKTFAEFDRAIRTFGVVTQSSGTQQLADLRSEVERLAAATTKTPQEIANVAVELGKAGFTAEQARIALAGVVQSSEATGESLTRTGEVIGATLNQFGLNADQSLRIADLLTQASNASAAGTNDLGEALSYVGSQAAASNQSVEDTITTLALLANTGIKGSSAGTGLAEALRRIKLASANASTELDELRSRGSKNAVAAFETLNQGVRDAEGQLLPFPQILDRVKGGLVSLEQIDKELLLNALFGVQGGRVIQSLLGQTDAQVRQVTESMKNASGASAQASSELTQGLGSAITLFGSSLELANQKVGQFLSGGVEPLVRGATVLLNGFLVLPAPVQAVIVGVGALTATLAAAVAVYSAFQLLNVATNAALVAKTAVTVADAIATQGASAAQLLFNTQITLTGARALATAAATGALTLAKQAYTAAVTTATASTATLGATLLTVVAPLAVLAAGIALVNVVKTTQDMKNFETGLQSVSEGSKVAGDAAITLASKTKNLNDEIARSGKATDEQKQKAQQLIAINKAQIKSLQDQLAQAKALVPANAEQKAAQDSLIANIEASIGALESQTGALEANIGASKGQAAAARDSGEAAKQQAEALKEARAKQKQQKEDTFQDQQQQREDAFQDAKQQREDAFRDQQQAKADAFRDQQQAKADAFRDQQQAKADAFRDQQQVKADAFQSAKQVREDAFRDQQQVKADAFQSAKQVREDAFRDQQQAKADSFRQQQQRQADAFQEQQRQKQDAFNKRQQAAQDAFNKRQADAKNAFDKQLTKEQQDAERAYELGQAKNARERRDLQKRYNEQDAREAVVAPFEERRKQFEEQQQSEAKAQKEQQATEKEGFDKTQKTEADTFKQQQQEAEKAFVAQLREEERAFKEEERARDRQFAAEQKEAEKAFQKQQKEEEKAFQKQQKEEEKAFQKQEKELERAFKKEQKAAERAHKEAMRQFDLETAKQVKAILESTKIPPPAQSESKPQSPKPTPQQPKPTPRRFGGSVTAGGLYWTGEAGPEPFIPATNGYIIRHEEAIAVMREQLGAREPVTAAVSAPPATADPLLAELRTLRKTIEQRQPKAEFPVNFNGDKSEANYDRYYRFQRSLLRGLI